jgi:zinc transporter, ZIP family
LLKGEHHSHHDSHGEWSNVAINTAGTSTCEKVCSPQTEERKIEERMDVCPFQCCSEDPGKDLDRIKGLAAALENEDSVGGSPSGEVRRKVDQPCKCENEICDNNICDDTEKGGDTAVIAATKLAHEKENKRIMSMSINTAVAIGLHNFPEGLATFVATLNDPKVGVVLATAIAIHNIPEGICVALPVYYATGSRWKAFGWALLSGISEPIAALFGWAVLSATFSNTTFAILFGFVAGMMVIISFRELLPTAHRYDTDDSVVTYSFMAGMAVMAFSLVLFLL